MGPSRPHAAGGRGEGVCGREGDLVAAVPRRGRGDSEVPEELKSLGVTSREVDVLNLVADRLGNRDIAARLYLSPRTVEKHVASLMAKTGVADRGELATYAQRVLP